MSIEVKVICDECGEYAEDDNVEAFDNVCESVNGLGFNSFAGKQYCQECLDKM